jgi:hypothetical protein
VVDVKNRSRRYYCDVDPISRIKATLITKKSILSSSATDEAVGKPCGTQSNPCTAINRDTFQGFVI